LNTFWQDLRFSARLLGKRPGFTATAVIMLALGIGGTTAIFSVVYAALLRPLPFAQQDDLVVAWKRDTGGSNKFIELSVPEVKDWQAQARSFQGVAAMPTTVFGYGLALRGRSETVLLESARVTGNFFTVLGARPALGRVFSEGDDRPGATKMVVLSDHLWRDTFGADPGLVGQTVTLNEESYAVVGVMPPEFEFPRGVDLWAPVDSTMGPRVTGSRGAVFLMAVGRLKPGVSARQGQAELDAIVAGIAQNHPETKAGRHRVVVTPLPEHIFGNASVALTLLFAASALLLLIACTNVANLMLARATARRKEFAVRAALGASRAHMIGQLGTESALLAAVAGILGSALSFWMTRLLVALAPADIPRIEQAHLNTPVLLFGVAVTLLTAMVFGLAPALTASRPNLNETLSEGSGKVAGERTGRRLRSGLVVGEVALTVVLLAGATLILRSFLNLSRVDLGFHAQNVLTVQLRLSGARYRAPEARRPFFRELLARLEAQPGVVGAAVVLVRPLEATAGWDLPFCREGQSTADAQRNVVTNFETVTPHYFRTLGIPIKSGRAFTDQDDEKAPPVVIVSETLAQGAFGPGVDPVGKRLKLGSPTSDGPWRTVVGVAGNVHYRELQELRWDLYAPYAQSAINTNHVAVRTSGDPALFAAMIRREVAQLDPNVAVASVLPMDALVARSVARPRFSAVLLSWLSGLALLLAVVGLYGVMSYSVLQRTSEIGVRVAIGAQTGDILRLVIGQGMKLVAIGLGIGLVAAFALTRGLNSLLFGVTPTDPITFTVIALVLVAICLLACWLPARRAARVDPLTALRTE
jgi:putative ABC transport system permease protein